MSDNRLNEPLKIRGCKVYNRVVFNPMESADCETDGSMSEYTLDKYNRFARSGAGIVWFEANSVCKEGRTSEHQMMLTEENVDSYKRNLENLRAEAVRQNGFAPLFLLQLTHSGRQSIKPMIVYHNGLYEKTRPVGDDAIVSDEYLENLIEKYFNSAKLAKEAGFDGIDVKICHGYLLAELLSAFTRPGKYGGSFENRTRLYREIINSVSALADEKFLISSRIGVTDCIPGGFACDEEGKEILSETEKLILSVKDKVDLFNITIANPYYNPSVSRPCLLNKDKDICLNRFYNVGEYLKKKFPDVLFVNSALSCYREKMFDVAEKMLKNGVCDFVGFGRITLAYPEFYGDYLSGHFDAKKCCVTCSKCTQLLRNKTVSGCVVFNPRYSEIYKETLCKK